MVETWTERIANLSVPTIVLLLGGLTALRLVLRALRRSFFLFLSEFIPVSLISSFSLSITLSLFLPHSLTYLYNSE